jgi:hypothetical protein
MGIGSIGMIIGFINRVCDMGVDDERPGHVDIQHLCHISSSAQEDKGNQGVSRRTFLKFGIESATSFVHGRLMATPDSIPNFKKVRLDTP